MDDITHKTDLLRAIAAERQRLDALLNDLSDEQMLKPSLHGGWSVKDTLAHITAWEQTCLRWIDEGQAGGTPAHPAPHTLADDATVDEVNRGFFEQYHDHTLADVRAEYERSYRAVCAVIESLSEADLFEVGRLAWTGEKSVAYYLRCNSDWHYAEHSAILDAWRAVSG